MWASIQRGRRRKRKNGGQTEAANRKTKSKLRGLPAAQGDDGALERAEVRNHGTRAGRAELSAKLAARMTASNKTDHGHAGGDTGCNSDRRIFDHQAFARLHPQAAGDVQE